MDENEMMDPSIVKGLFEQGLMGIETSADHGGAEMSFTSAIIAIEELAKIDPSVSVMCDVHNTLVNTVLRTHGTPEQKDKWLPLLAQTQVCTGNFNSRPSPLSRLCWLPHTPHSTMSTNQRFPRSAPSASPSPAQAPTHSLSKPAPSPPPTAPTTPSTAQRCG